MCNNHVSHNTGSKAFMTMLFAQFFTRVFNSRELVHVYTRYNPFTRSPYGSAEMAAFRGNFAIQGYELRNFRRGLYRFFPIGERPFSCSICWECMPGTADPPGWIGDPCRSCQGSGYSPCDAKFKRVCGCNNLFLEYLSDPTDTRRWRPLVDVVKEGL